MMRGALAGLIALAVLAGALAVIALGAVYGGPWRVASAVVTAGLLAALIAPAVVQGRSTTTYNTEMEQ